MNDIKILLWTMLIVPLLMLAAIEVYSIYKIIK